MSKLLQYLVNKPSVQHKVLPGLRKMQMAGQVNLPGSQTISINDPRYPEMYRNRQVGAYYDGAFTLPDLDEVTVTGKDERVKEGMSQGINKFYGHASELMSLPQTEMMKFLTGKRQTPSQAWGFDTKNKSWYHPKTVSNFLMDATLDPTNLVGVGIVDDLTKGAVRAAAQNTVSKTLQRGLSPWGYDFENIARVPQNLIRNLEGKSKKLSSVVQRTINEGKAQFVLPALKNREDAWSTYLGLDRDFNTMKLVGSDDATGLSKYEYTNPIVFEKASPRPNPKTGTQAKRIAKALYDNSEGRLYNKRMLFSDYRDDFNIIDLNVPGSSTVGNDKLFVTMGGYQKYVSPDGKHLMYRDVWDLQPFSRLTSSQLPRDMVGNAIRNFEVSSLIPGARPFVAEGKLGDIKTKFLPAQPYKDIRTRYNEQLSWARNAYEPEAFIRDIDNPTPEEIFAYDQAIKNQAKRNLIEDVKNKRTFLNPKSSIDFKKYVDTNPYTRFGDSTPDFTGFDFSPSTLEKLLKKIQNIGNQPVTKFNMGGPIVDPRGQWAHPGKRTIVPTPTGRITMQGVPYPVYGQDETGFGQMMYPGGEYKFPGQMVDEMPMMRNGGGLLSKSVTCSNCGWSWKAVEGGINPLTCHKCGGTVKMQKYQDGGEKSLLEKAKKEATNFISKEIIDPFTMKSLYFLDALKPINNREIYETIRPVEYPNIQKLPKHAYNYIMGNKNEPFKEVSGRPHISEEFWATALNIPMEKQYLKESQYKPSTAKNPNAKYYTIRDVIDQDALLGITKDLKPGTKMHLNGMLPILDSKWYSKNRKSSEGVDFEELDPLQRYTLEKSPDGSYVSIYDKYDFENPALNRMLNTVEIYDRFYIDKKANKQSELLPSSPKKKNGGQHGGLDRWFAEKWVDVKTGKDCGRQEGEKRAGYPACRPSKRVSSETPKTSSEMSSAEKAKFKANKTSSQRINYNHKRNK